MMCFWKCARAQEACEGIPREYVNEGLAIRASKEASTEDDEELTPYETGDISGDPAIEESR